MFSLNSVMRFTTALCATLSLAPSVSAAPAPMALSRDTAASGSFWMGNIKHQGSVWGNDSYTVFRDITKYGAVPDGTTDAADAIQAAIDDGGGRCTWGCNSSTVQPAIVYFPPGKYMIGRPINMTYYTQIIGDAVTPPTIYADPNFEGMALFDADPYHQPGGISWYINQNNFFRQMRNLVFDFETGAPPGAVAIHWQVAQATSLQNIVFKMAKNSNQQGIFMDNGSGGFFSDLTFSGGKYGAFLGSQQFTSRNIKCTDVDTCIFMNWNWGWVLSDITVDGGRVGIDMSNSPLNQTVGSVILADSKITNTQYGIITAYNGNNGQNTPVSGGTLVIDNVDMTGVQTAAVLQNGTTGANTLLEKPTDIIKSWVQGNIYDHTTDVNTKVGFAADVRKSKDLLDSTGAIYGRSKPQYENLTINDFVSAKDSKCAGDGTTDDTENVQNFLNSASQAGKVAYFDHGAYLIKDTITVPDDIRIVGEIWPLIVADGASFNDSSNPKAVFKVGSGKPGASIEISDLIFETNGPAPGAIMIQWDASSDQGKSGMWDSHVRIGGSYGTNLQTQQCRGSPGYPEEPDLEKCGGVFLMFHATKSANSVYLENDWFWVADHDLDDNNQTQISLYSARGALFNSPGPTWLWGTASEHSIIYNYQLDGVKSFFSGFMQTETPYFQPKPTVPAPLADFTDLPGFNDPRFTICNNDTSPDVPCKDAWGMRIVESSNVLIYATGMYSFFNDYTQQCVRDKNCQQNMIRIQGSQVDMYTVTTIATVNMIVDDARGDTPVKASENRDVYGDTLAFYSTG